MSRRPSLIINLKPTPSGFMVLDIETQLYNQNRTVKVSPPPRNNNFEVRRERPDYREDESYSQVRELPRGLPVVSEPGQPLVDIFRRVPVSAGWFSEDSIHPIEVKALPQFFSQGEDTVSLDFTKGAEVYKFYRNSIVRLWRETARPISTGMCRKLIPGNACSIMRVHRLLESWGIINFTCKEQRGLKISAPARVECHICSNSTAKVHVALAPAPFCICVACFEDELYPRCFTRQEFTCYDSSEIMGRREDSWPLEEELKLLELVAKEREGVNWGSIAKELGRPREKVLAHFLKLPATSITKVHVFENGEDITQPEEPREDPTVFEDFTNLTQLGAFFLIKKAVQDKDPAAQAALQGAVRHAEYLAVQAEDSISRTSNLLVELHVSKLADKASLGEQCGTMIGQEEAFTAMVLRERVLDRLKGLL